LFEEELAEESIGSVSAEGETQWRSKSANSEDTPKSDNVRNRPLYDPFIALAPVDAIPYP
jgi:hypothetical protein